MRIARIASGIAAALGIVVGLGFLFGPLYGGCSVTATSTSPGVIATLGPQVCTGSGIVAMQPVWPMPLLAILAWSLAPSLVLVGALRTPVSRGFVLAGVLLEATVLISFGAAPIFVPLVLLPTTIAVVLTLRAWRSRRLTGPLRATSSSPAPPDAIW